MKAETIAPAEPAEGSADTPHVARRILVATVVGFAMLVVLGGRSRADTLDPAQATAETATHAAGQVTESASDAVGQVAQTASDSTNETASTVVHAANETAMPTIETTTDAPRGVVRAVTDTLHPARNAAETVLHDTVRVLPQDPSYRQPPLPGATPPNLGSAPTSRADPSRPSTAWAARPANIASVADAPTSSSIAAPETTPQGPPTSGASHGRGGGSVPFGPLGRGVADGPLTLLVLFAAMAASLIVRPPPIRSLLIGNIAAPAGVALALSVERPG